MAEVECLSLLRPPLDPSESTYRRKRLSRHNLKMKEFKRHYGNQGIEVMGATRLKRVEVPPKELPNHSQ